MMDVKDLAHELLCAAALPRQRQTVNFYIRRNRLVLSLKNQGVSRREIAALCSITPGRVNQILAKMKRQERGLRG